MEGDCSNKQILSDYQKTILDNALPMLIEDSFLDNPFSAPFALYYLNTAKLHKMVAIFCKENQKLIEMENVSDNDVAQRFVDFLTENVQNRELIKLDRDKFERSYSMGFIYLFDEIMDYNTTGVIGEPIWPLSRTISDPNIAYRLQSTCSRSVSCYSIIPDKPENKSFIITKDDLPVKQSKSFRKSIKTLGKRIKRAARRVFGFVCPCSGIGRRNKRRDNADI